MRPSDRARMRRPPSDLRTWGSASAGDIDPVGILHVGGLIMSSAGDRGQRST
jgi:hypothetical protein